MTTKLARISAKCRELLALVEELKEKWSHNPSHVSDLRKSESGWRSTLAAIDWLDGMTPQVREAVEKEILTAWPDELL